MSSKGHRVLRLESLDSRNLLTAGFQDLVLSEVVNRAVFYNNSVFDGNDVAATFLDDAAIAQDKTPLLPGSQAGFQNYTSYSRGINGLMVDIAGLPDELTLADVKFEFSPATAPDTVLLTEPPNMSVRKGGGLSGSDRFTFVWDDGSQVNGWLKVTILATARTGLKAPDVFYFGNAIGETGNSVSNAQVNSTDELSARNNRATFLTPAAVTNRFDFNRDALVNATDEILARSNQASLANSLRLITAGPKLSPAPLPDFDGFNPATDGYASEYEPSIVKTTSGTLLLFVAGRVSTMDNASRDILLRRSFDNGETWSPAQVIYKELGNVQTSNIVPIIDKVTGKVIVLFTTQPSRTFVMQADADGSQWSAPVEITASVNYVSPSQPGGVTYPSGFFYHNTGPGHGIQLEHGTHAGRLIITANHRLLTCAGLNPCPTAYSWSNVIYSDDHGLTWHLGGGLTLIEMPDLYSNEASIVELNNGDLYMNIRIQGSQQQNGQNYRGSSISRDGGLTWTNVKKELALTTPSVSATVLRVNENVIAFAAPDSPSVYATNGRRQMTVWLSYDEAQTWVKTKVVYYSYAGYSDMTLVGPDTIMLAFNSGRQDVSNSFHQRVSLARFNLAWLESEDQGREFIWNFNEKPASTGAVVNGFPDLMDDGLWDLRAGLQGNKGDVVYYVPGSDADAALALTDGADRVVLTPKDVPAIQVAGDESLTVEMVFKTNSANGTLIGSLPGQNGWSLVMAGGKAEFTVRDSTGTATITSSQTVNDGAYHTLTATRDRTTGLLRLTIDGVSAVPVLDPTADLRAVIAITLGSYSDGTSQLAVTVDRLRIHIP